MRMKMSSLSLRISPDKCLGRMWFRRPALLLLTLAVATVVASADVRVSLNAPLAQRLAAYAQAAKLPPLGSHGPEIRVWVDDLMEERLDGFIITRAGIARCKTRYQNIRGSIYMVKSTRCKPMRERRAGLRALALLKNLSVFNGKELDCGWQDGDVDYVEGGRSARTFAFEANNPEQCSDTGSRLATKLLIIIDPRQSPRRP